MNILQRCSLNYRRLIIVVKINLTVIKSIKRRKKVKIKIDYILLEKTKKFFISHFKNLLIKKKQF